MCFNAQNLSIITAFKGYCQSSVGCQEVVSPTELVAVARGPIWLCAFGPAVLHGCTPWL